MSDHDDGNGSEPAGARAVPSPTARPEGSRAAQTTPTFARILGPFFTIAAVTVVARSAHMRELLADFESTPVWSWVVGAFILICGLVVVVLHPHWRGLTATLISVSGWFMAVRGFVLLAFPELFATIAEKTIGAEALWRFVFAVIAMAGLYLTWVGWIPVPKSPRPGTGRGVPR